ncbi:flagellar biosynthesis anti-sigma factor FlgM [Sphingomonas koreensis]|nr:flagellar biosynthesis anti-sigma factor FlgM [Sphingomonas koreensis]
MVDPVGAKPVSSLDRRIAPVAPSAAAAAADPVTETPLRAASVASVAHDAAVAAPIDQDRVAALRAAIAAGSYRIDPETVADRLIGHQHEWTAR